MPQGKRLTIDEALKLPVTGGPKPLSVDEALRRPVVTQRQPQQPQAPIPTGQNLAVGAASGALGLTDPVETIGDILSGAVTGDFRPLKEAGKRFALGVGRTYAQAGLAPGADVALNAAVEQAKSETASRRLGEGDIQFAERAVKQKRLAELAAQDPSLAGKLTRGVVSGAVQSVPYVAAGPGGVPAMMATGAAASLGEPENLPLNVVLAALPAPAVGKFVAPILRRIRGGRNVPVAAAEAPIAEAAAPVGQATPTVQNAMRQFEEAVARIQASNLTPKQKAAELEAAIQAIGREASGIRPVSARTRAGYPPPMVMPENPNPIQQAGRLPFDAPEEAAIRPAAEAFPMQGRQVGRVVTVNDKQYRLTPEQEARWAAEVDQPLANARRHRAQLAEQQGQQEANKYFKGRAMSIAARKREIVGALTEKEQAAATARQASNYIGKPVTVDINGQQVNGQVQGVAFGRVRVKLEDGQQVAVPPDSVTARGATNIAPMDAGPPQLGTELEPPSFSLRAAPDVAYSETVGPRVGETAAFEVAPASAPPKGPPPEFTGSEPFKRMPKQQDLFTGATVAPAERTPVIQTLSSLFKAGMLTRPNTHLKNLGGNLGFQISEEVARIPGAIVDMMVAPFTKRRTLSGPSLASVGRSAYQAATKGRQEAWQILRTGRTPVEIEGLQEIASGSKVIDGYVNGVFRLLKAEDAVFKSYALKRALEDRIRSAVLTEIRQGATPRGQYAERFRELMKYPPADLANGAVLDAEVATFNNANITGSIRTGITKSLERFGKKYPAAKPVAQTAEFAIDRIVPFAKTPANVIARMLEYTPVGAGKESLKAIARRLVGKSMTAEQQRQFSTTFGRAAAGSGILALGYVGYRDGWLTGMQEDDTSKRARDTAAGRIPGAIRIGNTWHQIAGSSPIANVMAIGATLAREAEQEQQSGKLGLAGSALKVAGQAALEQPLLSGTKQLIEGVEQPGSAGARYLGGLAGSAVPGIVSDVGQLIDPSQREARTIGARVMERIPGVRQTLPERLNVLGQPVEDRATQVIDPSRTTTDVNSPLFRELVRLDAGISGLEKDKTETDTAYRAKVQNFGRLYTNFGAQLVSSPQYQRATDEIRLRAVKILNEKAKKTAKEGRKASGALLPAALIGAAKGEQARERARKNAARK